LHNSLLIYGSRTFWCLMRNGSNICWTFRPLALWKETFDVPDLEISFRRYVYLENRQICGMRIHDLGLCVSYREMVEFL
jgi:hypothetical protein